VRVPMIGRLRRVVGRLRARASARAVILMYHRVTELDTDPWGLAVAPGHFAEHLEVIRRHGRPMQLLDLARAQLGGRIPRRAVVVTFDDGYADNLHSAKPLLVQHDVPATVFVTTGKIGRAREFWWDELEHLLLQAGVLPTTLELPVSGRAHRWKLGRATAYSEGEARRDRKRKPWHGEPGSRLAFYYAVYDVLRLLAEETREEALARIAAWAGAHPVERPTHRTLSLWELQTLADGGLIDIGAHSVTHPFLSAHAPEHQRHEVQESKRYLERQLARRIHSFAYPHGEYTPEALDLVRGEFLCACSAKTGGVWRGSDRFRLPRFEVEDWDGDEFGRRLTRWLANEG
jgi:peptidoglycan/xylan/chitin deacetylase (PgdA/CDA1 family)